MGDIENVVGSSYADEIRGNKLANLLSGRSGDDIIYCGGGNDTAQFGALTAAIKITINKKWHH
jgi:Ca2+-binding RTX toxin-like protein